MARKPNFARIAIAAIASTLPLAGCPGEPIAFDASVEAGARDAETNEDGALVSDADATGDAVVDASNDAGADASLEDLGNNDASLEQPYPCAFGELTHLSPTLWNNEFPTASVNSSGRWVAFDSRDKLVPADTNDESDVYVLDRVNVTYECISISSSGSECAGDSIVSQISDDGRFVLFLSTVPLDPLDLGDGPDIYLRDRLTGTTELISKTSVGDSGGTDGRAIMSKDAQLILWLSASPNLLEPDNNGSTPDLYLLDRLSGVLERVNVTDSGEQDEMGANYGFAMSSDGRFVAFNSRSRNLVSPPLTGSAEENAFVRDRMLHHTELVSTSSTGAEQNCCGEDPVSISDDGRYVAFESGATNLVRGYPRVDGLPSVFIKDRVTGAVEIGPTSVNDPLPEQPYYRGTLSRDGRFLAFVAPSCDLAGDVEPCIGYMNYYIRDLTHYRRIWRVTKIDVEPPVNQVTAYFPAPQWSADGSFLAFMSELALVPEADNDALDSFVFSFCGGE